MLRGRVRELRQLVMGILRLFCFSKKFNFTADVTSESPQSVFSSLPSRLIAPRISEIEKNASSLLTLRKEFVDGFEEFITVRQVLAVPLCEATEKQEKKYLDLKLSESISQANYERRALCFSNAIVILR